MRKLALYIHIPFCKQKCFYCDFNSFAGKEGLVERYVEALIKEIKMNSCLKDEYEVSSIYIGGGTPSYIESHYIGEILETVFSSYVVDRNVEITIEVNPGTVNRDKLKAYYDFGINRISFGVQSANNEILKGIGRIHTYEEVKKNYLEAREIGFNNISVDLIFGLPKQSLNIWEKTIDEILLLKPEHISAYSLKVEEGTAFFVMQKKDRLELPSDEVEREMYYLLKDILKDNGYNHYEISNFAKKDFNSKHNIAYWKRQDYLGVGSNSASCINNVRFSNEEKIEKYIELINNGETPVVYKEELNEEDIFVEKIILGLRLLTGINEKEILAEQFEEKIEKFIKSKKELIKIGLIEQNGDIIKLTDRGLDLANQVFIKFME